MRGYRRHGAANQEARFEVFCRHSLILPITNAILDRAADLWAHAHRQGVARNDADLIIAATALEHGRTLVTGNIAHYDWIDVLTILDWRQPAK